MHGVPFIDRARELALLEDEWRRPGLRVAIVYGRRRVGKTRLLLEWLRRRRGAYYEAVELSYPQLAMEAGEAISRQLGVPVSQRDLVEALEQLAAATRGERVAVVLDEFQYIAEADPSLPSRLQRSIDTVLSRSSLFLVLSGSAVSWFERGLLSARSPLHGRRTMQLRVRPMRLLEASGFWPSMEPADALRSYSIVGGTPAYLAQSYGARSSLEVLREALRPGSPLLEEAMSLLRQELREPRSYAALLRAVAEGRRAPAEAAQAAGLDPRSVHRYIEVLEDLDILARRAPLGRRRGSRLYIVDEYFRFYFSFTVRYRSMVEAGMLEEAVEEAASRLDLHASETLERFIEQHLGEHSRAGVIPVKPVEHGPWWHRGEEIDLVVRDAKAAAFIEAKWSSLSLQDAARLAARLEAKAAKTGLQRSRNYYIVYAREIRGAEEPVTWLDEARAAVSYTLAWRLIRGEVAG